MNAASSRPAPAAAAEIASLMEVISNADARLEALLAGETDPATVRSGRSLRLRRARERLHHSEAAHQAAMLSALPSSIALLDARGVIVSVNASWKQFGADAGPALAGHCVGSSYLASCDAVRGDGAADAAAAAAGIRTVLSGEAASFALEYRSHSPAQERWFLLRASALAGGSPRGAVLIHSDITLRTQTARALAVLSVTTERRERMLNTALSSITDFSYIIDAQGRLLFANQKILDMWGVSLEQAIGKGTYDLGYPRDDADRIQAQIRSVFATGERVRDEITHTNRSGETRFYAYVLSPVPAPDGSVEFVVGCTQDITLRKRSELALQRQRTELRTLLDLVPAMIWFKDTDNHILRVNERGARSLGRTVAEVEGKSIEDIYPAGTAARYRASDQEIIRTGKPVLGAVELRTGPGGGEVWIQKDKVPFHDESGAVAGIVIISYDITERRLLEQAEQRSQRQLRHVMDGLGPSIFVALLTPEGILVEVNRSPLEAAGLTAQDVLGKPFAETPGWRDSPHAQQQLRDAIARAAHGEASRFDVRLNSANGEAVDIDFSLRPLRDDGGKVIFLIPSAIVITERKRAETALRESESEFRALADSMPQIVWMARPDGSNIYSNQQWRDYTGQTSEQTSGFGWQQPFHPQDQQRARDAWTHAAATLATYMLEFRLRRADGTYRWWLVRGVPQRDAAGEVLKWVGTCTDIHDLKLAELEISRNNRELHRQQTELRVLFDLMPALVLFKDTENRILRINRHGARAAGRRVEDIEGRSAFEIYPEMGEAGYAADLEVIQSGKPQLGTIHKMRDRQGLDKWVQRDRVPYRDESGKVIGIVLMAQDITQRKRDQDALRDLNTDLEARVRQRTAELTLARSEAEQASRAKSDFLAAMSHEIRTPMSGLLGLLELLQLSTLDSDQHSTLGLARESGSALLSIIDDILDFSKIEANRLELNLVAGSVKEIVENACRLHSQIASSKNLFLRFDVAAAISPLLAVDPLRLGQILNNFLNNAIKFTDQGSVEVLVELVGRRQDMEELRFVVRDTGIGMSAEQMGRLFQPFVQAGAGTSGRFGGTGLGLVISRRLAELMGGTVEIQSQSGGGTTLTLLLALEICDAAAPTLPAIRGRRETLEALMVGRRSAPSAQAAQAEGTLLLVVDDHPTNRQVLVRQLASLGYAAEAADDGVEALALWQSGRFGAVITDCNMPRMNGYELAMAIRGAEQRNGSGRVPVIACTANALPAAVESCLAAGMDDYIVKPADLTEMSRKLERWLPLPGAKAIAPQSVPAASPAAISPVGLLDLVLLAEISGGSALAQAQILGDFRRINDLDAASLRSAAEGDDFPQVVASAHRIKGASLMLGATSLAGACGRIETAGTAKNREGIRAAVAGFDQEMLRLNGYLDTFSGGVK